MYLAMSKPLTFSFFCDSTAMPSANCSAVGTGTRLAEVDATLAGDAVVLATGA